MSDITKDGLTADTVEAMALEWIAENPGKPIQAKLLRALLADECQTCDGSGVYWNPVAGPGPGEPLPCPDCDGRGWLPKDGVDIVWIHGRTGKGTFDQAGCERMEHDMCGFRVTFSDDWLEADNE